MAPELLSRAAAVLAREVTRMQTVDARAPLLERNDLDAHERNALGARSIPLSGMGTELAADRWLRQAQDLVAALSSLLGQTPAPAEDRVPLLHCFAPVEAGEEACASLRVSNEEPTAIEAVLYSTAFIADGGYEIPSHRVGFAPRIALVPANGEVTFDVKIAVPRQAPAGLYSGLIQATGCKYVKAVLSLEVL